MDAVLRKVHFPLKLKLLTVMIVLIAASLIIFVGIALQIFREDKSAYIFETLLNKASTSRLLLKQQLENVSKDGSFEVNDAGKLVFGGTDVSEILEKAVKDDSAFKLKVVIPKQNELLQWNGELKELQAEEKSALKLILSQSLYQSVKDIKLGNEGVIYAYDYDSEANFAFVAYLEQSKAFEATNNLIDKSIYYGLFILGVSMLFSVLLARPLTSQLETLFGMTQDLAKGNFSKRVTLKGHDEVGALSDSINDMASKIVVFMDEMKEKARLENEVAVAQLVQASFFPAEQNAKDIFGQIEPASECGGDWWGYFDHGDWRTIFIADATGHGVPAALLTATMNCCKTSLKFILESRPDILREPNEILRYMNQAVYGSGKEIQVTCFVASLNKITKELVYSNSSHPPSLLFSGSLEELSKDSFQPLIEANGPRLGQSLDSEYSAAHVQLSIHDTIFLYTDGLIEAENTEKARWGERRLLKSLGRNGKGTPQEIVKKIMQDFKIFVSDKPSDDDITVVVVKVDA